MFIPLLWCGFVHIKEATNDRKKSEEKTYRKTITKYFPSNHFLERRKEERTLN